MPENLSTYQARLNTLRQEIEKQGLDGFIVPRTDEFQGEFLAPYSERLQWLCGFTGSAGVGIVLGNQAVVMSDGRYTIQLAQQVDDALYELADSTKCSIGEWLSLHAVAGSKVGYDVWLHTPKQIEKIMDDLDEQDIELVPIQGNLIDVVWGDQPDRPSARVRLFPDDIAGQSSKDKRLQLASVIREEGCRACFISAGDSVCWLLNVRGSDIEYSPLMLSYLMIYEDGIVDWFINPDQVPQDVRDYLGDDVRIIHPDYTVTHLSDIDGGVMIDRSSAPCAVEVLFKTPVSATDPCSFPKSLKTNAEQDAVRQAHILDGVAMVKFLHWVDKEHSGGELTELSVEEQLDRFRQESPLYLGASFSTIAGFNANGAIVHYRATLETSKRIEGNGLLLVDSGGQYKWGTTDITRTIAIGAPTEEMKRNYTYVLCGHIDLAMAQFESGTTGRDLDEIARAPLKAVGLDYAHGTGHGVGCYLCVHEAAANISPRGEEAVKAGMLISNEPGYYKEDEYGIRIENLILAQGSDEFLCFETITLAPYDASLIDLSLLNDAQIEWLSEYSLRVWKGLSPHLQPLDQDWLRQAIAPFCIVSDEI